MRLLLYKIFWLLLCLLHGFILGRLALSFGEITVTWETWLSVLGLIVTVGLCGAEVFDRGVFSQFFDITNLKKTVGFWALIGILHAVAPGSSNVAAFAVPDVGSEVPAPVEVIFILPVTVAVGFILTLAVLPVASNDPSGARGKQFHHFDQASAFVNQSAERRAAARQHILALWGADTSPPMLAV
jgi:hypothetical protein